MTRVLMRVFGEALLLFVFYATLGIPADDHSRSEAPPMPAGRKTADHRWSAVTERALEDPLPR